MQQINSETDFVARNDQFRELVGSVAAAVVQLPAGAARAGGQVEEAALKDAQLADGTRWAGGRAGGGLLARHSLQALAALSAGGAANTWEPLWTLERRAELG